MKRVLSVLLCAAALTTVALTGCGNQTPQSSVQTTTAASVPSATDATVVKSTESANKNGWVVGPATDALVNEEQNSVFQDSINNFEELDMKPIAVLGEQVVAGTNYAYLCYDKTRTEFPTVSWDVAVVYKDLYNKSKLTSIIEINLSNINTTNSEQEAMTGAWQTVEITEGTKLDDTLKNGLDSVLKKEYVPIAVLGTNHEDGTTYSVLVQEKNDGKPENYLVELRVNSNGEAELVKEEIFNLYYYLSINN